MAGKGVQPVQGKAHPAVFPDGIRTGLQIALKLKEGVARRIPGHGTPGHVLIKARLPDSERQVHAIRAAHDRDLQLALASGRGVVRAEREQIQEAIVPPAFKTHLVGQPPFHARLHRRCIEKHAHHLV